MKSILLIIFVSLLASNPAFAKKKHKRGRGPASVKHVERAPASAQCITSFKDCVTELDLEARGRFCQRSVSACQGRFNEEQESQYRELSKRCDGVEKSDRPNAKPAANYCRAALTQFLLFN